MMTRFGRMEDEVIGGGLTFAFGHPVAAATERKL